MRKREKCKKNRAITDINAPNSSRDIPFQSQEFEQDGRRHFVGYFSFKRDVNLQDSEKLNVQYLMIRYFDLFEILQAS